MLLSDIIWDGNILLLDQDMIFGAIIQTKYI